MYLVFGIVFMMIFYLVIGFFFVILRFGNVLFEIGVKFFLLDDVGFVLLIIFIILFFMVVCLLLFNFIKIIDVVGKFLMLIKLIFIGLFVVIVVVYLIGII